MSNNRQLYYFLRKEREKLDKEKQVFSLEKQEQDLEIQRAETWVEIQKRKNENKDILHQIETERLRLAYDQQQYRIIEIQAEYDASIKFFEQKINIMQLIEQNKSVLHQQEIKKLEMINEGERYLFQQEKILAEQTLVKEQTKQLVYSAQKEKEVTSIIHNHTDNLRRIQKQMTDLQSDKSYYKLQNLSYENLEERSKLIEKMTKSYTDIKLERLELMKTQMEQKQDFLDMSYQNQYDFIRDRVYKRLNL